jgi:hypothetical protein
MEWSGEAQSCVVVAVERVIYFTKSCHYSKFVSLRGTGLDGRDSDSAMWFEGSPPLSKSASGSWTAYLRDRNTS